MKIELEKVVNENFSRYAGNVILDRAICDVRDMLKPAARMLMYSQREVTKNLSNKPFVKSARVVGDALGRYYTHGDSSCYGTYMRMAKPFAMRYPLEECQGNSGTIIETGDEAAMRYTELRPSKISDYLFKSINKNTVSEWKDNFDETLKYPGILPTIGFYNIVNGTTGIGVSLSSSIPQFNLKEVNAALVKLIEDPDCPFDEIYCAPDFATGGTITNAKEVKEALRNGTGSACRIRSVIDYDKRNHELVISEIPYGVYTNTITEELKKLLEENENYGIEGMNDSSGKEVSYTISLTKGVNPWMMIKKLYKDTSLESFYTINMVMLDKGRFPKVFGWREACQAYIDHIRECKKREIEFDLNALVARNHILEGLMIAVANIDEVVKIIRGSDSAAQAKERLKKTYNFDEEQTKAILDMKLQRLANLEAIKINNEYNENSVEIDKLNNILGNQKEIDKILINILQEVAEKFGDARRTKILNTEEANEEESKEVLLTLAKDTIKVTKRLAKGTIKTTTTGTLIIVTEEGKLYHISVKDILNKPNTKVSMFLDTEAQVVYCEDLDKTRMSQYWGFATQNDYVKISAMDEYNYNGRQGGKMLKLKEGDKVIYCWVMADRDELVTINKKKYDLSKVLPSGKSAMGTKNLTNLKK